MVPVIDELVNVFPLEIGAAASGDVYTVNWKYIGIGRDYIFLRKRMNRLILTEICRLFTKNGLFVSDKWLKIAIDLDVRLKVKRVKAPIITIAFAFVASYGINCKEMDRLLLNHKTN